MDKSDWPLVSKVLKRTLNILSDFEFNTIKSIISEPGGLTKINAGVSPCVVTGAATVATAMTQTAIASALYSCISQGFGMAFNPRTSWWFVGHA